MGSCTRCRDGGTRASLALYGCRVQVLDSVLCGRVRSSNDVSPTRIRSARFGKGRSGDELPPELADVESRLQKIREAKRMLEQEAAEELAAAQRDYPHAGPPGRPRKDKPRPALSQVARDKRQNRLRRAWENAQEPGRQYNFTDPDSRVMRDNGLGCFVQGYNAQAAVDGHAQVIVAADVTQEVVDRAQLLPMCECMRETLGRLPEAITADAGYWHTVSLESPALGGCDVIVSPDAMHRWKTPKPVQASPAVERMRERLKAGPAGDRGAGVRPDQRGAWAAALLLARAEQGEVGVEADLPVAQPVEAVPGRLDTAAVLSGRGAKRARVVPLGGSICR